jgi:hypothetical protein
VERASLALSSLRRGYMLKLVLAVMIAIPAFGQTTKVRPQVNPLEELARQILAMRDTGKQDPKLLEEFVEILFTRVVEEIEAEAMAAGMDKDKYIESSKSMDKFLADLKTQTIDLNNISDAKALVLTNKVAMRLRIQESARIIPERHNEKAAEVRAINRKILAKLKIPIEQTDK